MKKLTLLLFATLFVFGATYDVTQTAPCKINPKHLCTQNQKAQISGLVRTLYENGNLLSETTYFGGQRHGVFYEYYESGDLKTEIHFSNNKAIKGYKYTEKGKRTKLTHAHFYNQKINY